MHTRTACAPLLGSTYAAAANSCSTAVLPAPIHIDEPACACYCCWPALAAVIAQVAKTALHAHALPAAGGASGGVGVGGGRCWFSVSAYSLIIVSMSYTTVYSYLVLVAYVCTSVICCFQLFPFSQVISPLSVSLYLHFLCMFVRWVCMHSCHYLCSWLLLLPVCPACCVLVQVLVIASWSLPRPRGWTW